MSNSTNQPHSLLLSSEIIPKSPPPPPPHYTKRPCRLKLKSGISFWNFLSLLLISFAIVETLLMGSSLLSILIQDKKYYNVGKDHLGDIYGSFGTYVECFALLSQLTSGYLQDIFGRKIIVVLSLFLQALTAGILPFGGNLYPGLFLIRIVQASAAAWCLTTPLLPDYVCDQSKGTAGGCYQIAAGLGSLIFSFGMLQIAQHFDILFACELQALILFLIAVYCLFFVKNVHKSQSPQSELLTEQRESLSPQSQAPQSRCESLRSDIKFVFTYIGEQRCLILVLVSGFVGRIHDLMFSTFLSLWISKYIYSSDTQEVSRHLMITLGIGNAVSLPLSILLGLLFDRYRERVLLPLVQLLAALPYLWMYFYSPLDSTFAYFLQVWGTSLGIQINAISYMMLAQYAPQKKGKGAVYGFYYFICGVAVLGFSYLGGWIIDQSFNKFIFLLAACFSFGVIVVHLGYVMWGARYFKN